MLYLILDKNGEFRAVQFMTDTFGELHDRIRFHFQENAFLLYLLCGILDVTVYAVYSGYILAPCDTPPLME